MAIQLAFRSSSAAASTSTAIPTTLASNVATASTSNAATPTPNTPRTTSSTRPNPYDYTLRRSARLSPTNPNATGLIVAPATPTATNATTSAAPTVAAGDLYTPSLVVPAAITSTPALAAVATSNATGNPFTLANIPLAIRRATSSKAKGKGKAKAQAAPVDDDMTLFPPSGSSEENLALPDAEGGMRTRTRSSTRKQGVIFAALDAVPQSSKTRSIVKSIVKPIVEKMTTRSSKKRTRPGALDFEDENTAENVPFINASSSIKAEIDTDIVSAINAIATAHVNVNAHTQANTDDVLEDFVDDDEIVAPAERAPDCVEEDAEVAPTPMEAVTCAESDAAQFINNTIAEVETLASTAFAEAGSSSAHVQVQPVVPALVVGTSASTSRLMSTSSPASVKTYNTRKRAREDDYEGVEKKQEEETEMEVDVEEKKARCVRMMRRKSVGGVVGGSGSGTKGKGKAKEGNEAKETRASGKGPGHRRTKSAPGPVPTPALVSEGGERRMSMRVAKRRKVVEVEETVPVVADVPILAMVAPVAVAINVPVPVAVAVPAVEQRMEVDDEQDEDEVEKELGAWSRPLSPLSALTASPSSHASPAPAPALLSGIVETVASGSGSNSSLSLTLAIPALMEDSESEREREREEGPSTKALGKRKSLDVDVDVDPEEREREMDVNEEDEAQKVPRVAKKLKVTHSSTQTQESSILTRSAQKKKQQTEDEKKVIEDGQVKYGTTKVKKTGRKSKAAAAEKAKTEDSTENGVNATKAKALEDRIGNGVAGSLRSRKGPSSASASASTSALENEKEKEKGLILDEESVGEKGKGKGKARERRDEEGKAKAKVKGKGREEVKRKGKERKKVDSKGGEAEKSKEETKEEEKGAPSVLVQDSEPATAVASTSSTTIQASTTAATTTTEDKQPSSATTPVCKPLLPSPSLSVSPAQDEVPRPSTSNDDKDKDKVIDNNIDNASGDSGVEDSSALASIGGSNVPASTPAPTPEISTRTAATTTTPATIPVSSTTTRMTTSASTTITTSTSSATTTTAAVVAPTSVPKTPTTTPPSSPPTFTHQYHFQHKRNLPPLDAVDLGPLDALAGAAIIASSSSTAYMNNKKSQIQTRNGSPLSSPTLSPLQQGLNVGMGMGLPPSPPFLALAPGSTGAATIAAAAATTDGAFQPQAQAHQQRNSEVEVASTISPLTPSVAPSAQPPQEGPQQRNAEVEVASIINPLTPSAFTPSQPQGHQHQHLPEHQQEPQQAPATEGIHLPPSPTTLLYSTPISLPSLPSIASASSSASTSHVLVQPCSSRTQAQEMQPQQHQQQQMFLPPPPHAPTFPPQPLGGLDVRVQQHQYHHQQQFYYNQEQSILGYGMSMMASVPMDFSAMGPGMVGSGDGSGGVASSSSSPITLGPGMTFSVQLGMDVHGMGQGEVQAGGGVLVMNGHESGHGEGAGSINGAGVSESDLGFGFHGQTGEGAFGYVVSVEAAAGGQEQQQQQVQQHQQVYDHMYQATQPQSPPLQPQQISQDASDLEVPLGRRKKPPPGPSPLRIGWVKKDYQEWDAEMTWPSGQNAFYNLPHHYHGPGSYYTAGFSPRRKWNISPLEDVPKVDGHECVWKLACKYRVYDISRRYMPDSIRSLVSSDAHTFSSTNGPVDDWMSRCQDPDSTGDTEAFDMQETTPFSQQGPEASGSGSRRSDDEDMDEEDFMNERTYAFELLDDDEVVEGGGSVGGLPFDGESYDREEEADYEEVMVPHHEAEMCDDDDEETDDEDEEVEEALRAAAAAVKGKERAVIGEDDEDAEGEMETDIEAFSDPTFNAELSSSMSSTTLVGPHETGGGFMNSFYIPPAGHYRPRSRRKRSSDHSSQSVSGTESDDDGASDCSTARSQTPEAQDQQQQQDDQHSNQGSEEDEEEIHGILPLPPPRLSSFPVSYLRTNDNSVTMMGKGTPLDRLRSGLWSATWPKRSKKEDGSDDTGSGSGSGSGGDGGSGSGSGDVEGSSSSSSSSGGGEGSGTGDGGGEGSGNVEGDGAREGEGGAKGQPMLTLTLESENGASSSDGRNLNDNMSTTPPLSAAHEDSNSNGMADHDVVELFGPMEDTDVNPSLHLPPSSGDAASSSIPSASDTSAGGHTSNFGEDQMQWDTHFADMNDEASGPTIYVPSPSSSGVSTPAPLSLSPSPDILKQQHIQQIQIQQHHGHHAHVNMDVMNLMTSMTISDVSFSSNATVAVPAMDPSFISLGGGGSGGVVQVGVFDMGLVNGHGAAATAGWFSGAAPTPAIANDNLGGLLGGHTAEGGSSLAGNGDLGAEGQAPGLSGISTLSFALG